jgi:hypothetical protein
LTQLPEGAAEHFFEKMTFTEAAVEILRLVGRPLHYKKITELAIERNLLSHVGKAPELTMSSRLATMVKKDRGEEPITKVKPGVFALRDFTAEMMALADSDEDIDLSSLPPAAPRQPEPRKPEGAMPESLEAEAVSMVEPSPPESEVTETTDAPESSPPKPVAQAKRMMPGSEVFPEEDDDDEPILAGLDDEEEDDKDRDGRRGRRRRRRGGKGESDEATELRSEREPSRGDRERDQRERHRNDRERDRDRDRHRERDRERERRPDRATMQRMPSVDLAREPGQDDLLGRDLADAVYSILVAGEASPLAYVQIAEQLVRRGRLVGDPAALAPTVSAAIRADVTRNGRSRFRYVEGRVALVEWYLPREAARQEADARRFAERQRDQVRRAFLRKLQELPTTGFVEILATWLNAEGVSGLRAVRRPGSSPQEIHLAGVLRRGPEEVRVAVLVLRDGREIPREKIVEMRGSLHHYGSATAAWIITTGSVSRSAREEVAVAGALPVALFEGLALAEAMESRRIGLVPIMIPISTVDLDLLDSLRGAPESIARDRGERDRGERDRGERDRGERDRGDRGERDRDRGERGENERERQKAQRIELDRDEPEHESEASAAETSAAEASEETIESAAVREPEGGERTGRRRRRRRRGRGNASVESGEAESGEAELGEAADSNESNESNEHATDLVMEAAPSADAAALEGADMGDMEADEGIAEDEDSRDDDELRVSADSSYGREDDEGSVEIDVEDEHDDDENDDETR